MVVIVQYTKHCTKYLKWFVQTAGPRGGQIFWDVMKFRPNQICPAAKMVPTGYQRNIAGGLTVPSLDVWSFNQNQLKCNSVPRGLY